jgi:hypothetical protein
MSRPVKKSWGGAGSGDFKDEADRYTALIEMLEGGGGGSGAGGGGGSGGGAGNGGGGSGGGDNSSNLRRHTATDPALVLETRSVKLSRRCGSESCSTGSGSGNGNGDPGSGKDDVSFHFGSGGGGNSREGSVGGGKGGSGAAWLHVTVEAPRTLIAAARRDAVVRWIRDAYIAALKPHPPQHTLSELQRMARSGGNVAPAPAPASGSGNLSRADTRPNDAAVETVARSTTKGAAGKQSSTETTTPSTGGWSAVKGAMGKQFAQHRRTASSGRGFHSSTSQLNLSRLLSLNT